VNLKIQLISEWNVYSRDELNMRGARELELKPSLGLFDATAIGIGAIIGGGIFVVTGIVAGVAGPSLVVSIIIAAVVAALTALSYVELAEWLPKEGSIYEYARRLISPFSGFLAGWMWVISNIFSGAAVSLAFSHYLTVLFPVSDPRLIAFLLCVGFTRARAALSLCVFRR
jgi:APA family basic amino acid/polyamine antiporter